MADLRLFWLWMLLLLAMAPVVALSELGKVNVRPGWLYHRRSAEASA